MDKIEAQFESYKKAVIPQEASETQIRETRRAFYAGAASMMTVFQVINLVLKYEKGSTLWDIQQELRRFSQGVIEGRN